MLNSWHNAVDKLSGVDPEFRNDFAEAVQRLIDKGILVPTDSLADVEDRVR